MTTERPNLIKHLEFIQITIVRMAANSFIIKGWSVTLVAAILAFTSVDANPKAASIALIPAVMFWGLDAYYLRTERVFRALYDTVRKADIKEGDVNFNLDPSSENKNVASWFKTACSKTLWPFYLALILVIIAVWVVSPILAERN